MKPNLLDPGMYKEYIEKKGLVGSTCDIYTDVIELFITKYDDCENIDYYNEFLLKHAYNKKSYYFYYAILKFLDYKIIDVALRKKLKDNLIKPKNDDPIIKTIYMSKIRRERVINSMLEDKHKVIAKIQMHTGARIGDVLKLTRGSITFDNYNNKLAMKITFIGKRERRVIKWIFDKKLQNEIMEFLDDEPIDDLYYFTDFKKSFNKTSEHNIIRSNYNWYWQDLKQALEINGFDKNSWSTHDFRRSIAREIWDDPIIGKDVQLLQNFLGHKNTSTTLRYLQHSGLSNRDVSIRMTEKWNKL